MKIIIKMVLCAIVSLLLFGTKIKAEAPINIVQIRQNTPQEDISRYAELFQTDPNVLLKVADCESHYNPEAKGDYKNGVYLAKNIYQYHVGTWDEFVETYKKEVQDEKLDINSYHDQAKVTAFIFAKHPELRRRWTTYVAYANGGTYTFYSRLLEKQYTVVCK